MQHISTTPFGRRAVTAGLLAAQNLALAEAPVPSIDKWSLFRDLCTARQHFGISNRDLVVLNALISFQPGNLLEDGAGLIVFPSNKSLAERAHGMAESTLRRHLAALVTAGLIARHDSPNGKRYARRGVGGQLVTAFGFSLRPLLVQTAKITAAAQCQRETTAALSCARERVVLLLRDATKLAEYAKSLGLAGSWDGYLEDVSNHRRALRRKLTVAQMHALATSADRLNAAVSADLATHERQDETPELSVNDSQNERHHQRSHTDLADSEPSSVHHSTPSQTITKPDEPEPDLPLALVMDACSELEDYGDPVRNWSDLVQRAAFVRGMLGISQDAWERACKVMGPACAAISVGYILQNATKINAPGGYLRSLVKKAQVQCFSPSAMVFALLNQRAKS